MKIISSTFRIHMLDSESLTDEQIRAIFDAAENAAHAQLGEFKSTQQAVLQRGVIIQNQHRPRELDYEKGEWPHP